MSEEQNILEKARQKVTPEALTRAAYRYLERFASTEAQLVKVLRARIDRELKPGGDREAAVVARGVAGEVARRCAELGLVNDRLYAEAKARRLLARGKPLSMIGTALAGKGVGRADIQAALAALAEESEGRDLDFTAAVAYAKRRRLGPFARPGAAPADETGKRREYAAMARAGFGYDLSRRVLEAESVEELECQEA